MLKASVTPSRLIDPGQRPPVPIVAPTKPSPYRAWYILGRFLALFFVVFGLFVRRRLTGEEYARRLRELFEEFGGLWIKVGQLLSLRVDVFPVAMCREMAKLQSRALGFPGEMARQIVEEDLGAPIDHYFDEFVDTPFAAASIGQVHRARLRQEEVWVAVKVQKPYSAELFTRDLVVIEWIARFLTLLRIYPHMRWDEGLAELRQIMREELDFEFEASSMRRMRKTLKRHGLYVPRVFSRYTTPRVLVSEFIHAVLMADYIRVAEQEPERLTGWLDLNGIEPRKIARRMIRSLMRQLFEDNLYHGDMHPGNIVLLRGNRVALIDFGTTNFTEREYLVRFRMFARALATRDYAKAADLCLLLCASLPASIDVDKLKEKLIRSLRMWATRTLVRELPYHEKSIDNAIIEVMRVLFEYRCTMDWSWLRIHRAVSTLDASLIYLHPDVNYTKLVQRYFAEADERELRPLLTSQVVGRTLRSIKTGMDIQERINEYTIFQNSLIRRHAQVFQGVTNKAAEFFASFIGALSWLALAPAIWIALAALQAYVPALGFALVPVTIVRPAFLPPLQPRIWAAVQLASIYLFYRLRRFRRRLRQRDARPSHERVAAL
jgi:ubiquinone biosynthesis protein